MKKIVLALSFCCVAAALQAQTWKLLPVWSDDMSATYLSFGYPDDEGVQQDDIFFSLWGYRAYDQENSQYFEAEFFRANPSGMHKLLKHVMEFSAKYKSEMAVSYIYGVKVKTFNHPITGRYTCVYGPDGRDFCMYKAKRWASVYEDFVAFCKKNDIDIE